MEGFTEAEIRTMMTSKLFAGIASNEMALMLPCLTVQRRSFLKDEFIHRLGDRVESIGVVLTGSVEVIKEDYWGNRNIVAILNPGSTFAESYACAPDLPITVSVQASQDCEVCFLGIHKVLSTCSSVCVFHTRLVSNLVGLLAQKNLMMNEKLSYLTQRSTREKLLAYLSAVSMRKGAATFEIPFDRQQLADYLSVDRSAMSSELSRMRRDGIIDFHKNTFTLLQEPR